MPERIEQLKQWLQQQPGLESFSFDPASSDASFRRYFRICTESDSFIAMDAPPEQEDCRPFVAIARALAETGLNVPEILAQNLEQGFLLLSDLGTTLYLDILNEENAERLYSEALNALITLQKHGPQENLPHYDRDLLLSEMELFREWLIGKQLQLKLTTEENEMLSNLFEILADSALEQPQTYVHRDFHSRNLMVTPPPNPGIIDFQDAVVGPITYDLVSLFRDCYIKWPAEQVKAWALAYYQQAAQAGLLDELFDHPADWRLNALMKPANKIDKTQGRFLRWFDMMGVQRHLKASGIFARLNQRDGKPNYMKDIPLTLSYMVEVTPGYEELQGLQRLIVTRILPALKESLKAS